MKATPYDFATIPTKRMAAGAIFFDAKGNILIVKPTYRPEWLLPGESLKRMSHHEKLVEEKSKKS